jgi:hypothetical protein
MGGAGGQILTGAAAEEKRVQAKRVQWLEPGKAAERKQKEDKAWHVSKMGSLDIFCSRHIAYSFGALTSQLLG